MPELIIHIGTFKTGTTALQKFLSSHRDRLLSEHGMLFPRAGEIPAGGHHNLVYEITGSWKHVAERGGFQALEREVAEASPESVLISAENLSSYALANESVALRFQEFARRMGARIKVLCYVRPQWEYLDSYYSQGVKSGYTTCSFREFVESALGERMYDYEQVVSPWNKIADEIIVRPYPGRTLVAEVCALLGLSDLVSSDTSEVKVRNERFGAKRLEFMRRIGAALERTRAPFKRRIPLAHRLRDAIRATEMDDVPFSGLDDETVRRIHGHFEPVNLRLSQRFAMDPQWCSLPSGPFVPTVFDMGNADETDLRAFDDVLARILLNQDKTQ